MGPTSTTYLALQGLSTEAVRAALAPDFDLRAEPTARRARTFLDTFDGRVHATGRALVHDAAELALLDGDGRRGPVAPLARAPKRLFAGELPEGPLRAVLGPVVGVRALVPSVRVTTHERLLRVLDAEEKTVVRIVLEEPALDDGTLLTPRLRVDAVRGYDKAAARVLHRCDEVLALTRATVSVWDEAVLHVGGTPGGVSSSPAVDLQPAERADLVAARIARRLLHVIEVNTPGTLQDTDSEFLHDLRVAVRRTRALQRELRGAFPPEELARSRAEFRWLQAVTGPSRDLDVYVLDFDDFREALPPARRGDLDPLQRLLVARRAAAHRQMRRDLRSPRAAAALAAWGELLDRLESGTVEGPDGAEPIARLASRRISTVHRRMVKAGSAIDEASPAVALHDLRKQGKELRYLLEFFAPLYPRDATKPMIKNLKALQDTLGRFQDSEVQADLVAALADDVRAAEDGAAALMAMGLLVERLHAHQAEARAEFAERFATFASKDQRALVSRTFS